MAMYKFTLLMTIMVMRESAAIGDKQSLATPNLYGLGPNIRNPEPSGPNFNSLPFGLNLDIGSNGISKQPGNIGSGPDIMNIMNFGVRHPAVSRTPSFGSLGGKPVRSSLIENLMIPNSGKGLGGLGGQGIRFLNTGNGGMRNPNMLPVPEPIYNTFAAPRLTNMGALGAPNQFIGTPFEDVADLSTFGL